MFETGTKLGRYEIRSKIGEGGMGEVDLTCGISIVMPHDLPLPFTIYYLRFTANETLPSM